MPNRQFLGSLLISTPALCRGPPPWCSTGDRGRVEQLNVPGTRAPGSGIPNGRPGKSVARAADQAPGSWLGLSAVIRGRLAVGRPRSFLFRAHAGAMTGCCRGRRPRKSIRAFFPKKKKNPPRNVSGNHPVRGPVGLPVLPGCLPNGLSGDLVSKSGYPCFAFAVVPSVANRPGCLLSPDPPPDWRARSEPPL